MEKISEDIMPTLICMIFNSGKCMAIGIASALSYLMGFCAIKSFLALEKILQLSGVFLLFTSLSVFAGIYLAVRLPETEGKTFGEIQSRFN